jgi:hypothetical protein
MLSQDEKTVLLIAAEGEPMMPIGRWKPAVEALVTKGFMKPHPHPGDPTGYFNHRITAAGVEAVVDAEHDDDQALKALISRSNSIGHEHKKLRKTAEQIAVQLVDIAEASHKVTGDAKVEALRQWAKVILERALEMMR